MMQGRLFDRDKDLPLMAEWSLPLGGWVPPKELLSPIGVMVYEGETNCACGFLHMDVYTPISQIHWLLVNPVISPRKKDEAVHTAFAYLSKLSIEEDRPMVIFYGKAGIARASRTHGFVKADDGCALMVKTVTKDNFHE